MFLELKDIKKSYGVDSSRVDVLRGVDCEIQKGDICVLLGPSGSGKSTLLNIIGGIDTADSGYVAINGEKIADLNEKQLTKYRRKHLGYIFQMYNSRTRNASTRPLRVSALNDSRVFNTK